MASRPTTSCLLVATILVTVGCRNSPLQVRRETRRESLLAQQQLEADQQLASRDHEFQRRAETLDVNNRDLHTRLAQSQREVNLLRDELKLVRNRVGETADLLAQTQTAQKQSQAKLKAIQSSAKRRGGAIITANNSLTDDLPKFTTPELEVRQDADVVRIEIPSNHLFVGRSATLHQGALNLLDPVVDTIRRKYSRQMIGVEGHSDNGPLTSAQWQSHHGLTIAQATAIFDQLVGRYRLSQRQLFVLGHGANHPRVSNATVSGQVKNQRIEIVIYPDTIGSN